MIPTSQQVKKIGKFLFRNLGGAQSIKFTANMCDIKFLILYQLPYEVQYLKNGREKNDVHEMLLDLNITTYQNKIRVNVIEVTPEEKTLGYDLFEPEIAQNLPLAKSLIYDRVVKRVARAYKDYNFLI